MPFTEDNIRTIHTIAHCGSFATAAEQLHRVPSAISYTVRTLENHLGVELFDRSGHKVQLTPAGEYFINHSQLILNSLDSLARNTVAIANGTSITFTIVVNNIINRHGLVGLARHLRECFPHLELCIRTEVYNGCWEALYQHSCDIVIGAPNYPPQLEGIVCTLIGEMEWDFVVSCTHPLASATHPLTADDLRPFSVVMVMDTAVQYTKQKAWALEGQHIIYVPDLEVAIEFMRQGIGIGYMPHHLIKQVLNRGDVLKKALVESKPATRLFYAWSTEANTPVFQACRDYLQQAEVRLSWYQ